MPGQIIQIAAAPPAAILAQDTIRLIACTRPFGQEHIDLEIPAGATIAEMVETFVPDGCRPFADVWLADGAMMHDPEFVDPELWHRVRPKPGIVVTIRVAPGGGHGKNVLGIVLSLAVIAAAAYLGPVAAGALGFAPSAAGVIGGFEIASAVFASLTPPAGSLVVNVVRPPAPGGLP